MPKQQPKQSLLDDGSTVSAQRAEDKHAREEQTALNFGKKLAAIEKPVRDRGVKALSRWLSKRNTLSELDLLKIWKGLYYCKYSFL